MHRPVIQIQFVAMVLAIIVFPTQLDAQSPADQFSVAASYYSRGQYEQAIELFEDLIESNPNTEAANESYFFLGEAQLELKNHAHARIAYQKFLIHQRQSEFAERASFRLAEIGYRTNDLQAATLLEAFIREHGQSDLVQFAVAYLGEIRVKRNEPQLAQRVFEKALQQFPESPMNLEYRLGLAKALQQLGQNDQAKMIYSELLQCGKAKIVEETIAQLGFLAMADQDWKIAINHFQTVLNAAEPESLRRSESVYWLGRCFLELGEPQKATTYFAQLNPSQLANQLGPAVFFDGAVAWAQINRNEEASRWLQQVRKNWPHDQWADDALQLEIELAQRDGQTDSAKQLINEFKRLYPKSPLWYSVMESEGRIYYDERNYKSTIQIFTQLVKQYLDSGQPIDSSQFSTYQYFVGLGLIGEKEFASAVAILDQVITRNRDQDFVAAVKIARATSRSAIGQYQAAIRDYESYLAMAPKGSERERCLSELAISNAEVADWTNSRIRLEQLIGEYPESEFTAKTAGYIAAAALKAGELGLATQGYELLISPGNSKEDISIGLTGLAWVYQRGGDNEKALKHFERILTEFPNSDLATDAAMAHAKQLEDSRKYAEAGKTYQLVAANSNREELVAVSQLRIAFCMQKLGGAENLSVAKAAIESYLAAPNTIAHKDEAIYQLAWILNDLGQKEDAMVQFEVLATDYQSSKYWADATYRVAEHRFRNSEFDAAQQFVSRLLNQTSHIEILSRAIYLNGQLAVKSGHWDKVAESMQAVIARCKDKVIYAKANYWLAESLYQTKQYAPATSIFSQLLNKQDLLEKSILPWVALRTSQCCAKQDKWKTVAQTSSQALKQFDRFPRNFEHHYLIGRSLEVEGLLEQARSEYEQVVESEVGGKTETAAKAQWRIGETYFHQEDYTNAIKAFYKVDALFAYPRWRAAALYEAGKCQEHLGNWSRAVLLYEQLIKEIPENEFNDEAQLRLDFARRQAQIVEESQNTKRR